MASVASAGDGVADYSVNNPTGTIQQTISDTNGAFTMIAILDWDVLMSDVISEAWDNRTDILTTYNTSAWSNASWKQGVTLFRGDSATTLKLGIHKDYIDQAITGGDGYNLTLTEAGYGIDGKLALAYTFSGGVVTVAALQNDGTTWTTGSFDTTWSPSAMEFIEIGANGVIDSLVSILVNPLQ